MAVRRVVHSPPNTWPVVVEAKEKAIEKAVELEKTTSEEKAVEAEEKASKKVVERMDGTKEATRPRIRQRCKEKTMTSGKPTPKRRADQGGVLLMLHQRRVIVHHMHLREEGRGSVNHHSGCRLLSRGGRSLKQRLSLGEALCI
uniref:Uncharacterized protein n=1 Tax=Brassica oleracea TaxID=3712 RepID=A0A3P6FGI3_BRAOL|nr:unnamed protein product [Brassica oleracea]